MKNRIFTRLVFLFGAVIGLALLGWAMLPFFVSTEVVRSAIESRIAEITGQRVTIGTDADITLFPTPSAHLTDVVVAARGGPDDSTPIAAIDVVELDLSIGSLITGTPRFSSVRLIRPVFSIEVASDTTMADQMPLSNVRQAVRIARQQRAVEREQNPEQLANAAERAQITYPDWLEQAVGVVSISNGRFAIISSAGDVEFEARNINGTLNWPQLNAPLRASGTMEIDGEEFTVDYTTPQPIDAMAGEVTRLSINATSELATLALNGDFGFASGFFAVGDIRFQTASVRRFLAWRGAPIQAGRSLGALALSASMQARGQTIRLNDLEIDVDGNAGTGVLELAMRQDAPPTLLGTLDFNTLDLRAFLSAFTNLPRTTTARGPIDTSFMRQLQTDLRISAASATFDSAALTNIAATAQTTRDLALFDLGDATAFGGALQARLTFDRNPERPNIEINISGQDIAMALAKEALSLPAIIPTGQSNFSWLLNAPLDDWSAVLGRARGKLTLRQTNGTLNGFDPSVLRDPDTGQFAQIDTAAPAMVFESSSLDASIINGEIKLQDTQLRYSDTTSILLNGVVQLSSRSVAVTAQIQDDDLERSSQRHFIGGGWNGPYVFSTLDGPPLPVAE